MFGRSDGKQRLRFRELGWEGVQLVNWTDSSQINGGIRLRWISGFHDTTSVDVKYELLNAVS